MRTRYGYKVETTDGQIGYITLGHIGREEAIKAKLETAGHSIKGVTLHQRIKTGYRMNKVNGELELTNYKKGE